MTNLQFTPPDHERQALTSEATTLLRDHPTWSDPVIMAVTRSRARARLGTLKLPRDQVLEIVRTLRQTLTPACTHAAEHLRSVTRTLVTGHEPYGAQLLTELALASAKAHHAWTFPALGEAQAQAVIASEVREQVLTYARSSQAVLDGLSLTELARRDARLLTHRHRAAGSAGEVLAAVTRSLDTWALSALPNLGETVRAELARVPAVTVRT